MKQLRESCAIGSDRSSRNANLCPFVCLFVSKLSRAVNLHLSRLESSQRTRGAITEQSDSYKRATGCPKKSVIRALEGAKRKKLGEFWKIQEISSLMSTETL